MGAFRFHDRYRLTHEISWGLIVVLAEVLHAKPNVPYEKRIKIARFIEDLTVLYQDEWYSIISLHRGGSLAAMQ